MPQILLEYTKNVVFKHDLSEIFTSIHTNIVSVIETNLEDCKSRSISYDNYLVGNGVSSTGFILLTVKILSGRSEAKKKLLGTTLLERLKKATSLANEIQIRVSVEDIITEQYFF